MSYFFPVETPLQSIVFFNKSLFLERPLACTSIRKNHPFSLGELALLNSNPFSLNLVSEKGAFLSHTLGYL
jgi:hypothetical protein